MEGSSGLAPGNYELSGSDFRCTCEDHVIGHKSQLDALKIFEAF